MELNFLESLGSSIDNVFNYTSSDGSRKTTASLQGENLCISFQTILNSSRESDLHFQVANLKKESDEMIKSRLKTIEQEFKKCASRDLVSNKISDRDSFETLTISAYSPFRKLKYTCTYVYEVK